jgi:hypothetical protein
MCVDSRLRDGEADMFQLESNHWLHECLFNFIEFHQISTTRISTVSGLSGMVAPSNTCIACARHSFTWKSFKELPDFCEHTTTQAHAHAHRALLFRAKRALIWRNGM